LYQATALQPFSASCKVVPLQNINKFRCSLPGGGAGVIVLLAGDVFSGDGDAQLSKEAEVVLGEGLVDVAASGDLDVSVLFGGEVVESDGGFEHEEDIEAVLADVLDDAGDLLVLDDGLVDGLAELLNEFTHTCCHRHLQGLRPARGMRGSGMGFIYLTSVTAREQVSLLKKQAKKRRCNLRCYHHIGMKAENIGRALGIGLRVAGRMAGQKLMGEAQGAGAAAASSAAAGQVQQKEQAGQTEQVGQTAMGAGVSGQAAGHAEARTKGQAAGRTAKGVARGVGGFLRPFRRVGGILWLEVTGAFFFLFVLFFAQALWRMSESWALGENRPKILVMAALMAAFLYLSVSSFWRARRR